MSTFFSAGSKRSYNDFKQQVPSQIQSLIDSLREFCFSLGDNVIEDVRMHRVVFCKSITFRWFADIAPTEDGVIIKIQKSRKEPVQIIEVKIDQNLSEFTPMIKEAFEKIH